MLTKPMRTVQLTPVKAGPEGGTTIGKVYTGQVLIIDLSKESPHDGWVHIVGPNPPINIDGTYLKTGKPGWVEISHLFDMTYDHTTLTIDIDWNNKTWSIK